MSVEALDAHLQSGITALCRCWRVTRKDGVSLGFTDHDLDVTFDDVVFRAGTGLTASALSQTTGLSVDNTEAIGALTDAAISEEDIFAGRFDGADVEAWLVQWDAPENRALQFRGTFGEIIRSNGAFTAELRGLAEQMNTPRGRVFQRNCPAVLGDARCRFDLSAPGFSAEVSVTSSDGRRFAFDDATQFDARWFERGKLSVLSGAAAGLSGAIKLDRLNGSVRLVELWDNLRIEVAGGDMVRLTVGCDKRFATCRTKFNNALNFGGFPDIPSEDWQMSHPTRMSSRNGGSLR
ncbi:DUF2163 domain-containing protein [Gymnodinialimonas sp. 2305UL16-5]|uniref:DUF2163 domain-containing protein n=1 Tax=Gymnodinialimonas mytili TaxID=3126503 RepID=UPI00309D84A5